MSSHYWHLWTGFRVFVALHSSLSAANTLQVWFRVYPVHTSLFVSFVMPWLTFKLNYLRCLMTKPTKSLRPAKTQISLGICPVWSESSLCAQWVAKDPSFLHTDSEDSDQTGRMPRLIWVFAGRTCHFVRFVMRRLIYFLSQYSQRALTVGIYSWQ